ncbi:MAG: polysaccharide biosynthesis tyrosine autokinase, partial [Anaerolineae bacterium]|nr:polysaccharide biosynthesis tyrosine autokinase [Anaerolineae bacterium]
MSEELDLRRYAALVVRWWWLIALCAVVGAATVYLVSAHAAPVYSASTTLLVRQAPTGGGGSDYTALLTSERLARTYSEMLTGRPVLSAVIAELGLDATPGALAGRVSVELVGDTQLLRVSAEDADPARAAAIANGVAATFVAQNAALQEARYAGSLASMEAQIAEVTALIEETRAQLEAAQARLSGGAAAEGAGDPAAGAEVARLESLLAGYRNTSAALVQSYEGMRVTAALSADDVTIYEVAEAPQGPVRPQPLRNALLAGAAGALLGAGAALAIEYLDDTIKTPEDVRQALGLEALGSIGRLSRGADELVVLHDARSPVAEAYRALRTSIRFAGLDAPLRTVQLTSATTTEGKSFTTANLAATMAEAGLKVLAVDADLRRPRLHEIFGVPGERGLTSALLNGRLNGAVRAAGYEGRLALLPAGELPPNPAEVLGSQRLERVLGELRERADMVVIDSPPVLAVADAAVLAPQVDGVLLVVEAGRTRRGAARQAVERLGQVGARVIGVVLNG